MQNTFKLSCHLSRMVDGQEDYYGQFYNTANARIRNTEEKQGILNERLLLIGKNLIEMKENTTEKILESKKDIDKIKQDINKIKIFLETISSEFSKFARKDDLEILSKQAKMFQPLKFVKK